MEAQESIGHFVSQRLEDYWFKGSTSLSVNLPQINLGECKGVCRIAHLHDNLPGVLAHVNHVLGEENINVSFQSLATEGELGYVVTDVAQTPLKHCATSKAPFACVSSADAAHPRLI